VTSCSVANRRHGCAPGRTAGTTWHCAERVRQCLGRPRRCTPGVVPEKLTLSPLAAASPRPCAGRSSATSARISGLRHSVTNARTALGSRLAEEPRRGNPATALATKIDRTSIVGLNRGEFWLEPPPRFQGEGLTHRRAGAGQQTGQQRLEQPPKHGLEVNAHRGEFGGCRVSSQHRLGRVRVRPDRPC
jgi:hypothetical protein